MAEFGDGAAAGDPRLGAGDGLVGDFALTLRAACEGEEWAIARLWRWLHPLLLRYLAGRAGHAAEDVASEAWLRVARNLGSFRGDEDQFRAWFFTIARRALIDWQRKGCRQPATTVLDERVTPAGADDPAREAVQCLDVDQVLALLRQLPEAQAEVILLRVVAGLDTERVAEMLGKQPGAVRVLQHRGLRRLAEVLSVDSSAERAAAS